MSPVKKWLDATVGKFVDDDGWYGAQCMDLYADYQRNCLKVSVQGAPKAKDVWNSFNSNVFTKIVNTPSFVPKRGDVAIWDIGTYGHIAICEGEGDTNYFVSLDQNWESPWDGSKPAKYIYHNYTGFLGVLRPNQDVNFDQEAYDAAERARIEAEAIAKRAKEEADRKSAEETARLARIEADRLAAEKAEADRVAKEQAEQEAEKARLIAEEQKRLEEELKAKEERDKMSEKFTLNKEDLFKIAKGAGIALLGALGTYLLTIVGGLDFGTYTPFIAGGLSVIANTMIKYASGK